MQTYFTDRFFINRCKVDSRDRIFLTVNYKALVQTTVSGSSPLVPETFYLENMEFRMIGKGLDVRYHCIEEQVR